MTLIYEKRDVKIYYGTTAVAKMLGVSPKTVGLWFDDGQIPGHRLPSGARRMHIDDITKFAAEQNMPLNLLPTTNADEELSPD